jgi:hypothetical protein
LSWLLVLCLQLKVLFGIFSKARKAWSNLLKGELLVGWAGTAGQLEGQGEGDHCAGGMWQYM